MLEVQPFNRLMTYTLLRLLPPTPTMARLPVAVPEVIGTINGIQFYMTNPSRCSTAKELFWGRGQRVKVDEKYAIELFCNLVRECNVVLDIGANTGIFAITSALANPSVRVHAFEIVPEVFLQLYRNVVRNDLLDRVTCHHIGIGKDDFSITVPADGIDSSLPMSVSSLDHYESGVRVRFESLDRFSASLRDSDRVLIKLDVEGTEAAVLQNSHAMIERYHPDILCEVLTGAHSEREVETFVRSHGYHIYKVCNGFLEEASTLIPDVVHHDWFFSTRDAAQLASVTSVRRIGA